MYVPRGRVSWFIAVGGERRENRPPASKCIWHLSKMAACNANSSIWTVLRKNRDCDQSNSISQKKQRYNYIRYIFYNLPVHVLPSPVYPALHAHPYDPAVLLQTALASQLWELVEHSSISAWESGISVRIYLPDSLHLVAGLCIHFYFLLNKAGDSFKR